MVKPADACVKLLAAYAPSKQSLRALFLMIGTGPTSRRAYSGALMGAPARLFLLLLPQGASGLFLAKIAICQRRDRLSSSLAQRMRNAARGYRDS